MRTDEPLVMRQRSIAMVHTLWTVPMAIVPSAGVMAITSGRFLAVVLPLWLCVVVPLCVRAFRIALCVDEHGVEIRNYLRDYSLRWDDIKEIRASSAHLALTAQQALGFVLRDSDRVVAAQASVWPGRQGPAILRRLRALAEPHYVPVNVAPPRMRLWGASFEPMPQEQRTTVPRPRKTHR